jgi:outer membrane protein insertion porin family
MKAMQESGVESLPGAGSPAPSRLFPDEANPSLGLRLLRDDRDSTLNSSSGSLLQVDLRAIPQALALLNDGNSDAWQAQVEWRDFHSLGAKTVWAQRVEGGDSLGDPGYEERYQLGGTDLMRGFQDNRFRGKDYYCAQEELRLPLYEQLGAALSADLGDANDGALEHPRGSLQAGLRMGLPPSYGMKARLDLGAGDDGSRSVALQFGQTF